MENKKCGDISISKMTTEAYNELNLTCKLRQMQRTYKKETVLSEMYNLQLSLEFELDGSHEYLGPLAKTTKLTSFPVVVISHSYQEPNAWSTILWGAMQHRHKDFELYKDDTVSWKDFEEVLDSLFMETGRTLSNENKIYLRKIKQNNLFKSMFEFGRLIIYFFEGKKWRISVKNDNVPISRTELFQSRDANAFTHWEWLFAALKLIRDHLAEPWKDGFIVGFIDKDETKKILDEKKLNDLFLIRFAESMSGTYFAIIAENNLYIPN